MQPRRSGMSFAQTHLGGHVSLFRQQQRPLQSQPSRCPARQIAVQANKGAPDPPDTPKQERRGGREWLQTMLSRFGPVAEKAENTAVLDFEKPLVELDNRIKEVSNMHSDVTAYILALRTACMRGVHALHTLLALGLMCACAPYLGAQSGRGQRRGRL